MKTCGVGSIPARRNTGKIKYHTRYKEERHMKTISIINLKGGVAYEKLYIMQS